jgi:endonuclease/exonuclease/phosphatase family metal-dependent hydrolase
VLDFRRDERDLERRLHGQGIDGIVSIERVIATIASVGPDVVILDEVDQGNPRSGNVKQADVIANALNMNVVFCPTEGRTDFGNAVLSKYPIIDSFCFTLPQPEWMAAVKRGCVAAIVDIEGRTVMVMGTHLGLCGIQEVQTELAEIYRVYLGSEELKAAIDAFTVDSLASDHLPVIAVVGVRK